MDLDLFAGRRKSVPPLALLGEGLLAGLAGTAVMTAAQTKLIPKLPIPQGPEPRTKPRWPDEHEAKDEPATETTARRIVEGLAHRRLSEKAKSRAGNLVHFAFGAGWGGLLALALPRPRLHHGLLFGTLVWMVSDNGLLPLLRVASVPTRYSPGVHAKALLAHLVYGAGTALALRRGTQLLAR